MSYTRLHSLNIRYNALESELNIASNTLVKIEMIISNKNNSDATALAKIQEALEEWQARGGTDSEK